MAGAVALGGCLDIDSVADVEPTSLWEAVLTPQVDPGGDLPAITGQAGFIVQSGSTRVGFGLQGVDRELYWGIFRESCEEPGDRLLTASAYPPIPAGAQDLAHVLQVALSEDRAYNVQIAADQEMTQPVACGDLELVESP
ncbi:MAG: hypothetical protein ACOC3J_07960 [Gemmatimonadota bacterium]